MNQNAAQTREGKRRGGKHTVFIVLLIISMIGTFQQSSLNTVIPTIMREFQIPASTAQWLTSAYSLAMGIIIPATAFLIRRFSTKKLFTVFATLFTVGTVIAAAAPFFTLLILGRILQALGSGVLISLTQVITLTTYPVEKRGMMMGIFGLSVSAVPIFSPVLAGMIADMLGWSVIFWITAIFSALSIFVGIKFLSNPLEITKQHFDTLSMLLSTIGFSGMVFGLGNLSSKNPVLIYIPIAIGCVSLILFTLRQLRMSTPFLDLRILKNREFRLSIICTMLLYCTMMGGTILLPIYMQNVRGYSATFSGVIGIPATLLMALLSPLAGKLYDKFGIQNILRAGSGLMLLSCGGLCFLGRSTSIVYITSVLCLWLSAIGFIMMPLNTWGFSTTSIDCMANGNALFTSLRTVAAAIGTAIFVALMSAAASLTNNVEAQVFGIKVSFIGITGLSALLFLTVILFVKQETKAVPIANTGDATINTE